MTKSGLGCRRSPRRARMFGFGAVCCAALLLCLAGLGLAEDSNAPSPGGFPRYRLPTILPNQYIMAAADSIHAITRALAPRATDRAALYAGIRAYLSQQARLEVQAAKIYPKNQLEWLLITDYAADTLAADLAPLIDRYSAANPNEILTEGRQFLELGLASLPPTPDRMLGVHVVMLGNYAAIQADSLLLPGRTKDRGGVEDGVIRWVQDWTQLYQQAHQSITERHLSHLKHEDWVIVRLADNCGNQGADVWQLKGLMMAMVGVDRSKSPPVEQYAHEYHLASTKCPGDERYVYYDLPYLQDTLREAGRRAQEKDEEIQAEERRRRESGSKR